MDAIKKKTACKECKLHRETIKELQKTISGLKEIYNLEKSEKQIVKPLVHVPDPKLLERFSTLENSVNELRSEINTLFPDIPRTYNDFNKNGPPGLSYIPKTNNSLNVNVSENAFPEFNIKERTESNYNISTKYEPPVFNYQTTDYNTNISNGMTPQEAFNSMWSSTISK